MQDEEVQDEEGSIRSSNNLRAAEDGHVQGNLIFRNESEIYALDPPPSYASVIIPPDI